MQPQPDAQPTRTVHDSMGDIDVPADALYGAQTARALQNFPISGQPLPRVFIEALLQIKAAAARANAGLGRLELPLAEAIQAACTRLLADPALMSHFPIDVFQTGSGTSTNMNANEVVATLASSSLGRDVSPNDHVNFGQSSNDVIPSAIHVSAALGLHQQLLPALAHLAEVLARREPELAQHVKTGRTHLMDAMPVRLDQVLQGWRQQIEHNRQRLAAALPALCALAIGGTAVGTGVNTHPGFAARVHRALGEALGLPFGPADSFFAAMGSQDVAVALSGQLKTTAVSLMKIANDLRWMNSGPLAGLGEITLPALQPGSSIMPGKVNPVIPEAAAMVAAQVIGNDSTITLAGQSGNFELNVMLPLVARNLLESIELLAHVIRLLADKAIAGMQVNPARLQQALALNPVLATALNPHVGYLRAAEIARRAASEGRPILEVALEMTGLSREQLTALLDPRRLTEGGV
jgi:fumarate hydratase, class II